MEVEREVEVELVDIDVEEEVEEVEVVVLAGTSTLNTCAKPSSPEPAYRAKNLFVVPAITADMELYSP